MTAGAYEFTVLGRPQPAGSKRAFAFHRKGSDKLGVRVTDDAAKSRPWKDSVTAAAAEHIDGRPPLIGPLWLELTFFVARPAGHYGSGRNAGTVRPAAPRFPAVRPDVTKLIRAVEDALTGLAWRDDAQVVMQIGRKKYGHPERCEVLIQPINVLLPDGATTPEPAGLFE
jgi:Holliday junction resolvase RusA-like endonuclease